MIRFKEIRGLNYAKAKAENIIQGSEDFFDFHATARLKDQSKFHTQWCYFVILNWTRDSPLVKSEPHNLETRRLMAMDMCGFPIKENRKTNVKSYDFNGEQDHADKRTPYYIKLVQAYLMYSRDLEFGAYMSCKILLLENMAMMMMPTLSDEMADMGFIDKQGVDTQIAKNKLSVTQIFSEIERLENIMRGHSDDKTLPSVSHDVLEIVTADLETEYYREQSLSVSVRDSAFKTK